MIQKQTGSEADQTFDEGEDDDNIEYEVFYTSQKIKETLVNQDQNLFKELISYKKKMLKQAPEFGEKTLYPITEFAPVETVTEEPHLHKKKKGKCKNHDRSDDSGDEIVMSHETEGIDQKKLSEEQQEAIAKKQIQKMEQEALKMEIDDLFNKIVSGKGEDAGGKNSKSSKRSSSKNSQVSKKSRK